MTLEHARTLQALDDAVALFASYADQATGDEQVPSCPEWTTRELIVHLGAVHRWSAAILLSGERIANQPTPLVHGSLADWYAGCAAALLTALDTVDPDEPTPNPARIGETARYWGRRQLHETTVHTVDLMQALGWRHYDVDREIAADGIEEVLGVYFPRMTAMGRRPNVSVRVRLDATDRFDSWICDPGSDLTGPPLLRHGNGEAEHSIRGTTTELYLALWNRIPLDTLRYDSDEARALMDGPKTP